VGCATIPYSELQSQCVDQQKGVSEECDGKNGPVSCDIQPIESIKGSIITNDRRSEELKRERQQLDSERGHAKEIIWTKLKKKLRRLTNAKQRGLDG
jgi:hypothetical protein